MNEVQTLERRKGPARPKGLDIADPFLDDFTRVQWTSAEARKLWEPRISSIGQHWAAAELQSVEVGIRAAALQFATLEQLPTLSKKAAQKELSLTVLELGLVAGGSYSAGRSSPEQLEGAEAKYRVALTRPGLAEKFAEAWDTQNDTLIGILLGFPDCCRRFFVETWGAGSIDPTGYMGRTCNECAGPAEVNILLRWIGVRYVPHMPCSFGCRGSEILGRQLRGLMPAQVRAWADELLLMPMRWSGLHAIGEVVTPLFTLNFRTDHTPELVEINRPAGRYPEGSAKGLRFPYLHDPTPVEPIEKPAEASEASSSAPDPRDNGFDSAAAMRRAHDVILSVTPPGEARTVLDLGAGNGILARRLAGDAGKAVGVEIDSGRALRAQEYLDDIFVGDMFQAVTKWKPDITVFMPGRLLDLNGDSGSFLQYLRSLEGELVVYAYGDWLKEYGSLQLLCEAAGLTGQLTSPRITNDTAAGIWRWE